MNGEVKSYRLNSPMRWAEYKTMPDDLKIAYIKALRNKYDVPDVNIAEMLGVGRQCFIKEVKRIGLSRGKSAGGRRKWDNEGFYAWVNGVDVPTPVTKEEPADAPVIEEAPVHFYTEEERETILGLGEEKGYVEDDLPFEEPDPFQGELPVALHAEIDALKVRIDELLKVNEELMANHECDRQVIDELRLVCSEYEQKAQMLEAQMDVVRLIFGGKNNG